MRLNLLAVRLEREIRVRNRFRAKVGGLQTLTYMGMGLFFPLFSGISAMILSSTLGLLDKGTSSLSGGFLLVSLSYVPIILYLSAAFAHPERNAAQNLFAIAPYFLLASVVMLATQTYLANIL